MFLNEEVKNEISAELHLFKRVSPIWEEAQTKIKREIINEDVKKLCQRIYDIFNRVMSNVPE